VRSRILLVALSLALSACSSDEGGGGASGGGSGVGGSGGGNGGTSSGGAGGSGNTGGNTGGAAGSSGSGGSSGLVPTFVAQGHMGRTTISCDDGQTWTADVSDDPNVVCFDGTDCDHNPGAANGVVWFENAFFATFGWGDPPGGVRKSADGVTWDPVLDDTTFGDIAAGMGKVIGAARQPKATSDLGANWTDLADLGTGNIYNIREGAFADVNGGRFVFAGNDGDNRVIAVSEDGSGFDLPTFPADCDVSFYRTGGIAAGNGAILITSSGVTGCRSTDGGDSWETVDIGSGFDSLLLFDGTEFVGWGGGKKWTSSDGETWTSVDTSPADIVLGAVAVSDGGTYVGVSGAWGATYENQRFYRSTDGVTWTESTSFEGGHPIVDMAFGHVSPSSACPLP
jgi:hypothetical protein